MQATGGAALTPEITDSGDAAGANEAPEPSRRRRVALMILVALSLVIVAIDQIVKHLTVTQLADREPVRLFGGGLYLVHVRNSGAAFSMFEGYTFVFPVITVVVVGCIGWMARSLVSKPWAVALGLVLGGALGNFVDRVFRAPGPFVGHVVDMFSVFDDGGQVFPVFNIADSSLFVGVCLAILLELTGRTRDGKRLKDDA